MRTPMNETKVPLPDFAAPPVVEVALSVQLEPLSKLTTQDLAVFWSDVLGKTYKWKEAPAIPPAFEWFGIPRPPTNVEFRFQELEAPPPHRALFFSKDETALVQLQRDRFVRNWRKANNEPYPRYESIRSSFRDLYEALCRFIAQEKLGSCVPNQCEVTYVNHIPWGREGQPAEDLSEVLTACTSKTSDAFLPAPEQVELATRYVIAGDHGSVGRLHIAANPTYKVDDLQPLLALTLTARGRPASDGIDDVVKFLDLGREHVVRGFASITTAAMHQRWGRRA
jgi:uncharacterized protein (TIGR04255 family)